IFMRVALYARVSTCNGQSPEMQLAELREYVSRRGWEIFSEYVDLGISGSKESRPELNRLMADAHKRHFDVVLCWKVDRFGRSLIQERVRAGLRNAKLKGKTLGRPRRIVNGDQMARLREQGVSFREIA